MTDKAGNDQKLKRAEIISAVAGLIAKEGLASLTMRNIASHLNCSVGTLPHYFKGKDEIVSETLRWSNERIMSRLEMMPLDGITLDMMGPIIISSLPLDEQSDTEWRIRLCLWDYAVTNSEMLAAVSEVKQSSLRVLHRLIGHLQERGEISGEVPTDAICQTFYHLAIGLGFNLLQIPLSERNAQVLPLISYIEVLRPKQA